MFALGVGVVCVVRLPAELVLDHLLHPAEADPAAGADNNNNNNNDNRSKNNQTNNSKKTHNNNARGRRAPADG